MSSPANQEDWGILHSLLSDVVDPETLGLNLDEEIGLLRLNSMARLLHHRINTCSDGSGVACRELLSTGSESTISRILRSPAVCLILRSSGSLNELLDFVRCERALASRTSTDAGGWSAMGDVLIGDRPMSASLPLVESDGFLRGPSLRCGIPIDLSLAPFVGRPGAGLVEPRAPGPGETADAVVALDAAVDALNCVWPAAGKLFASLTSTIVVRLDASRPDETWGASSGAAIGRVVVVNPEREIHSHALAEHLLHETTHIAIDCAEIERPLLQNPEDWIDIQVRSPWTDAPLTVHALLHACAVWAVLLEYWSHCATMNAAPHLAADRRRFLLRGFDGLRDSAYAELMGHASERAVRLVHTTIEFASKQALHP